MANTTIYPYGTNGQLPSSIGVINDLTTGGADKALSAEMGYVLGLSMGKITNANDGRKYNVWVGTQEELDALGGDYEDNTIYLVGTVPAIAQKFNVNFNGGSHTSIPANTPQTVKGGSAFSVVVSAVSGYAISSATGTMVGGTLNKTENQDGTVTFSTSSVTGDISITASASVDSNAPIVWEDANMEAFMLSKTTHANPNYITYAEAAVQPQIDSFYAESSSASYPFANIKDVATKFNELQYFSNITRINLRGFSALTEVTFPYGASFASGYNTRISGSLVTDLEIPEGCTSFAFNNVAGQYIESITFPTTLATTTATNGASTLACPLLKVLDLSNTAVTTVDWYRPAMAAVEIIKFPPSLKTLGSSKGMQLTRYSPKISYVSFGTTANGSELETLRIDSYSGHGLSFVFYSSIPPTTASLGTVTAIYVPDAAVATYQAATGFTSYSSKIKGLSELPADWDTPSSNE